MNRLARLALLPALWAALAGPAAAQPATPAADAAAAVLEDDLRPLSLIAATAGLYRDRVGRYPLTPFELLGSPEAARTGLRGLQFAELNVRTPVVEAGEAYVTYVVVEPEVEHQTERTGSLTLQFAPDSARHEARFQFQARRDPNFGGRAIPLTVADPLEVIYARGRLCLDPARLAALDGPAAFAAAAPYFGDPRALSVGFDPIPRGARVAATTLPAGGRP